MQSSFKTPVAARRLNIPYSRLMSLIRHAKIVPPQKDSSGDYCWTEEDLAAVRQVLQSLAHRGDK
jgi:hypothetical protein